MKRAITRRCEVPNNGRLLLILRCQTFLFALIFHRRTGLSSTNKAVTLRKISGFQRETYGTSIQDSAFPRFPVSSLTLPPHLRLRMTLTHRCCSSSLKLSLLLVVSTLFLPQGEILTEEFDDGLSVTEGLLIAVVKAVKGILKGLLTKFTSL